jgi:hypothetical protein
MPEMGLAPGDEDFADGQAFLFFDEGVDLDDE